MIKGSASSGSGSSGPSPVSYTKPNFIMTPLTSLSSTSIIQGTNSAVRTILFPSIADIKDPDYERAKNIFYRELYQFQESRGISAKDNLNINGKEVDLYLLYQLVTSRGGWEKVNLRDEWDELLKYFRIPKATNSSVVMRKIYMRNLELYEKIHYLGEELDGKNDDDDDYDDFKHRRRYNLGKLASYSIPTPVYTTPAQPVNITDAVREQLGLAKELATSDYDRLLLSLQSPLPNEQDMAISVCTLLSNETRHALKFNKSPAVMEMLLAHAGIFNHCNTRTLIEEIYERARGLNFQEFWRLTVPNSDVRELLCECCLERYQNSVGIVPGGLDEENCREEDLPDVTSAEKTDNDVLLDDEDPKSELNVEQIVSHISITTSPSEAVVQSGDFKSDSLSLDVVDGILVAEPKAASFCVQDEDAVEPMKVETGATQKEEGSQLISTGNCALQFQEPQNERCSEILEDDAEISSNSINATEDNEEDEYEDLVPPGAEKEVIWDLLDNDVTASNVDCEPCCSRCPCLRQPTIFENPPIVDETNVLQSPHTLKVLAAIGQRIHQVSSIIRNLSFDKINAEIMGHNSSLLRFIVVSSHCSFGSLAQFSFDTLGNIAKHMILEDPVENPYSAMVISLVIDGIFSIDRFRVLRGLEILREWCGDDRNEDVLSRILDAKVYTRVCELLTLSDIMILVYALECILGITGVGSESMCNAIIRVPGSVDVLVALVTVAAQSYGPKGCIQMRVVETILGPHALHISQLQKQPSESDIHSVPSNQHNTLLLSQPSHSQVPVVVRPIALNQQQAITTLPPPALVVSSISSTSTGNIATEKHSQMPQTLLNPSLPQIQLSSLSSIATVQSSTSIQPVVALTSEHHQRLSRLSWDSNADGSQNPRPSVISQSNTTSLNGVYYNHTTNLTSSTVSSGLTPPNLPIAHPEPQVYSPSISLMVSGRPLTEDAWAATWMKAAFEQVQGCSIEQGKMYRMYCTARKEPNSVLSMEDFMNSVKCTYGAGIGPVIKNFGGTPPLSFLEGIRPKMTITKVGAGGGIIQGNVVKISIPESLTEKRVESFTDQTPTDEHIVTRETKTTSPILKATLSRPPKAEKETSSKKHKGAKGKKSRNETIRNSVVNPTSSAIRSLLASKVTQRQQRKLQLSETPKRTGTKNGNEKKADRFKTNAKCMVKVNGVDTANKIRTDPPDISSTSSSLHSQESVEPTNPPPITSFQGILRNGLNPETVNNDLEGSWCRSDGQGPDGKKFKGMLVDLLERKVNHRDNGIVLNRTIRITDRGLELLDGGSEGDSCSNASLGSPPMCNHISSSHIRTLNKVPFNSEMSCEELACVDGLKSNKLKPDMNQVLTYSAVNTIEMVNSSCETKFESEQDDLTYSNASINNSEAVSDLNTTKGDESRQMTFYSVTETQVSTEGVNKNCRDGVHSEENCFGNGETGMVLMSGGGGVDGDGISSSCSPEKRETVEISMDDADLLEKFNEISDLIVVPPEQFVLKRSRSTSQENLDEPPLKKKFLDPFSQDSGNEQVIEPYPAFKPGLDLSRYAMDDPRRWSCEVDETQDVPASPNKFKEASSSKSRTNQTLGDKSIMKQVIRTYSEFKKTLDEGDGESMTGVCAKNLLFSKDESRSRDDIIDARAIQIEPLSHEHQDSLCSTSFSTMVTAKDSQSSRSSEEAGNKFGTVTDRTLLPVTGVESNGVSPVSSTIHPIRPAVTVSSNSPPAPPAQFTLSRPMLFSPGQQIFLQSPSAPGVFQTARLLIPKPATTTTGGQTTPQTYFLVQPSQQPIQSSPSSNLIKIVVPTSQTSAVSSCAVVSTTPSNTVAVSNNSKLIPTPRLGVPVLSNTVPPIQPPTVSNPVITTTNPNPALPPSPSPAVRYAFLQPQVKSQQQLDLEYPYLCEWIGCGERFLKSEQVLNHAWQTHVPEANGDEELLRCDWYTSGCDGVMRKRLSLMTHLQDRHCCKAALDVALVRRKHNIDVPPPALPLSLGYGPNAAFHAIKRHAVQVPNVHEYGDECEGPVTKTIRLTAALILKNLCNYSPLGRRTLKRYESHLSTVAMSNVESARTISQLLYDMNELGNP